MSNSETLSPFLEYSTTSSGCLSYLVCVLLLISRTREALSLAHTNERGPNESLDGSSSGRRDRAYGHSSKIDTRNNSPELNNFLEDVLNAQDELKWIDRAVHRTNTRDIDSSSHSRQKVSEISRRDYHAPRRVYLEDEVKAKRQTDENSLSSLASLKRTILELSDSLNSRESEKVSNDPTTLDSQRKLLSLHEARSAVGVAIAYYDYEEGAEDGSEILEMPAERQNKREELPSGLQYVPIKVQIPKKDENAEEEKKDERERQKLKNKYPKEEFIGDTLEEKGDSDDEKKNIETSSSPVDGANSRYSSMVLKRIPSAPESEDPDYYSQCRNLESARENASKLSEDDSSMYEGNAFDNQEKNNEEQPEISVERTYLVISPSIDKRKRKRSAEFSAYDSSKKIVNDKSPSSMTSDKAARNYFALKITDDMFKGGLEQSNPLGEDKPIVERIESSRLSSPKSSSSSLLGSSSSKQNSIVSLRSYKTTSPEWKVIEISDEKIAKPLNSKPSMRGIGRRLTQFTTEEPTSHMNMSSTFLYPAANNQLSMTTLNLSHSNVTNNDTRRIEALENKNKNIAKVNTTEVLEHTNFSKILQSTPTTRYEIHGVTLVFDNSSEIKNKSSSSRIRRHAGPFRREEQSRHPRHKVHHEHAAETDGNHKKLSVDVVESDANHRKLTVLLAADNIEDESQIDLAVHGELAGKIVERIFEEVQRNEGLKVALGPGLYRKHKPQESMALDKMYRQGLDEDEVKETEAMMRRVMELLGRLVLDEVRRKTCATLAPDMRDFLQWTLGLEELAEPLSDQVPPLPMIPKSHDTTEKTSPSADKFLFQNSPESESLPSNDLSELQRKVSLLKSLINEYHALTEREKTKVQTVHDYLVRQLGLLMKYIETKEAASRGGAAMKNEVAGARLPAVRQQILQYQGSVPDTAKNPRNIFNGSDTEVNIGNYSSISEKPSSLLYRGNGLHEDQRGLWIGRRNKKLDALESRRIRHPRLKKRSRNDKMNKSLEYRKLLRQIATLRRRKRENLLGYEKPRIYIAPLEPQLPSQLRVSLSTTSADPEQPPLPQATAAAATEVAAPLSHSNPPINSSTPVRGKNRLEDEVLLLNKREAWRKENERLLEEVAFGKDTRNDLISGDANSERLSNRNQEQRIKRAFDIDNVSSSVTTSTSTLTMSDANNDLRSVEKSIKVFPVEVKSAQTINENSDTTANFQ